MEKTYGSPWVAGEEPCAGLARFSWRAALAGVVVALAVELMLVLLGLAIGATSLNVGDTAAEVRSVGIGMGIWSLGSMLVAIFVGGLVAGVSARDVTRSGGAIEGLVVWATTLLLTMFLLSRGIAAALAHVSAPLNLELGQAPLQQIPPPDQSTVRAVRDLSRTGSWIAFGTLLASSIAGMLGGIAGAGSNRRRLVAHPRAPLDREPVIREPDRVYEPPRLREH